MVAAARNEQLADLLDSSRGYFFNNRLAKLLTYGEAVHGMEEHAAIVEAVLDGDKARAERLGRHHVLTTMPVMLNRGGFLPRPELELPVTAAR